MSLPNTHYGEVEIGRILSGVDCLFFDGIGGVSMQSLAIIAKRRGYSVKGYDREKTTATEMLKRCGIDVYYEESADQLDGVGALVYTVAIRADNAQYAEAMRRGLPCISRADFLGYIMSRYKARIGVAGMHGKSTTTAMLDSIFALSGRDPTVTCGAIMKSTGSTYRIGGGDDFIFEACEYMDSFLDFYPTQAIVLNIEREHLDYFHSLTQIESSFAKFMALTGDNGHIYLNQGDPNVMNAAKNYTGKITTFGVDCPTADYSACEITLNHGMPAFTVCRHGETLCRIQLSVPGTHSVCDALATASAAIENGIAPEAVAEALRTFEGVGRRMDYQGKMRTGALVYNDYAHHPTEIASTLSGAAAMDHARLWCVFQPHTYSRTKEFFDDFAKALSTPALHEVILTEIYPARETDSLGMSPALLAEAIRARGGHCRVLSDFEEIAAALTAESRENDMILVMGAGDIVNLSSMLFK